MTIIGKKGLSGLVELMLYGILIMGISIVLSLPILLKWYMKNIYTTNDENYHFLLVFLYVTGIFCIFIVFQMRKIFNTLNRMNPFMMDNVKSLKYIAISSFIISFSYFVKIIFYNSFLTMIITAVFLIAGLFTIILSEVFRQAVIVKEENDLTI